jgi:hypothetical protein
LTYCPTEDMTADVLTKALPTWKVARHVGGLGLRQGPTALAGECWNIIAEWERWVDAEGERDDAQSVRGLEEGTSDVNGAPRATGSG